MAATLAAGRRPEAGDRAAREWAARGARAPTRDAGTARPRGPGGAGAARRRRRASVRPGRAGRRRPRRARACGRRRCARRRSATRSLGRLGSHLDSLGARFDGRLRIAAVDRASGRRVMFGAPGAPPARRSREAVLASCAVPGVFAPVRIGGREYVDGGVWSPTNLDAAPAGRGSSVLCLVPTALRGRHRARCARSPSRPRGRRDARRARPRRRGAHARARRRLGRGDGARPDGPEPLRGRCSTRRSPRAGRSAGLERGSRPRRRRSRGPRRPPRPFVAAALVGHAAVAATRTRGRRSRRSSGAAERSDAAVARPAAHQQRHTLAAVLDLRRRRRARSRAPRCSRRRSARRPGRRGSRATASGRCRRWRAGARTRRTSPSSKRTVRSITNSSSS